MIELPLELTREFEELVMDTKAIEAKYSHFVSAIHNEQRAIAIKARDLWKEARHVMNLPPDAEYNYNDGKLYPVEPNPPKRVPNAPDVDPKAAPVKLGL